MDAIRDMIRSAYKKRPEWSHKGNFGKVLVIGGSVQYTGSPALVASAALAAGADLATVAAPRRAADAVASFSPDMITIALGGDALAKEHVGTVTSLVEKSDAVTIGNGLGREKGTIGAIMEIISKCNKPLVIDADAIYAVAQDKKMINGKRCVITPHSREFEVLSGIEPLPEADDRMFAVTALAKKLNAVVLLKGHVDVISDGRKTLANDTGSPYMTKGGLGDTLAGVCAALLARGVEPLQAAAAAAYVNGRAGELAAAQFKEGLTATKLIDFIPKAIEEAKK